MKHLFHEAPHAQRATLLSISGASLLLILLACAVPAAGRQKQDKLRVEVAEGKSESVLLKVNNDCQEPHLFLVERSVSPYLWTRTKIDSVLIEGNSSKNITIEFGTTNLKGPAKYHGQIHIQCSDCDKESGCEIKTRNEIAFEVAVTIAPERIEALLRAHLRRVEDRFENRVSSLKVIRGTYIGRKVEGPDPDSVSEIIKRAKKELLDDLTVNELSALKRFIELRFQPPELETLSVKEKWAAASPESEGPAARAAAQSYAARGPSEEKVIATAESADRAFDYVRGFVALLKKNSGPITLKVESHPDGANVVLDSPGGKRYERSTNSSIYDFWRGTYRITVTKSGFQTITHKDQDVGFGNDVIECRLVTSGEPMSCRFR